MPDYKKELEEFSYIVSHDFNAPLRQIREFSKLLIKRLGDKVNDQEREYIAHIERNIYRTEAMLEGLLRYSRLNTQACPFNAFPCPPLLGNVIDELRQHYNDVEIEIAISDPPETLVGDKNQIRLLFFHLLDNAIKFRKEKDMAHITISATQDNKHHHFCISDQGIGIPEAQQTQVFIIFKKLDVENIDVGSGLTIAKKIVEHHGGDIKIKSQLGSGTELLFSLAKL